MADDELRATVVKLMCDVQALSELVSILLAELSYQSEEPHRRLEEIIGSEEGASMSSVGRLDRSVWEKKEARREAVFDLARKALGRMSATRQ